MSLENGREPRGMPPRAPAGGALLAGLGFAALSSIPLAMALIGPHGVAFLNEAAEALLAKEDGLVSRPGHRGLAAIGNEDNRHLWQCLEIAMQGLIGATLPIRRLRAPMPLLISISPLRDELFAVHNAGSGFALVLIHDPLAGCAASGRKALVSLYGLTEAEVCVAVAIVAGRNAKRIATARNVSVPTVRSQIRQILSKTGCADQREFVSRFGWLGMAI